MVEGEAPTGGQGGWWLMAVPPTHAWPPCVPKKSLVPVEVFLIRERLMAAP